MNKVARAQSHNLSNKGPSSITSYLPLQLLAGLNLNSMRLSTKSKFACSACLERNSRVKIVGLWAKMLYDTLKMRASSAKKRKKKEVIEPMLVTPHKAPPFILVFV